MANSKEQHIIDSWMQNAKPWTTAISQREIESRNLVTNQAIVDAVLRRGPRSVLDIGCGEGWLARALNEHGVKVHGIDVVPELVETATKLGGGTFQLLAYKDLAAGAVEEQFDMAVCNFSLLGDESVNAVFRAVPDLLKEGGCFMVQTVHPITTAGESDYEDGWRSGSWAGFNKNFINPSPWYFRTLESWKSLFADHHIPVLETLEPLLPGQATFASVIFVGQVKSIT